MVHETRVIYDSISNDLKLGLSKDDYATLKLLDNNFILYRYPTANRFYSEDMIDISFNALVNINSIVEEALNLSKRAKRVISEVEEEISITKSSKKFQE